MPSTDDVPPVVVDDKPEQEPETLFGMGMAFLRSPEGRAKMKRLRRSLQGVGAAIGAEEQTASRQLNSMSKDVEGAVKVFTSLLFPEDDSAKDDKP